MYGHSDSLPDVLLHHTLLYLSVATDNFSQLQITLISEFVRNLPAFVPFLTVKDDLELLELLEKCV